MPLEPHDRRRRVSRGHGLIVPGLLLALCVTAAVGAQKLTPEELVRRHLDALGPADARRAVTTQRATGTVSALLRFRGAVDRPAGQARIVSDGQKVRLGLEFGFRGYEHERLVFDGSTVTAGALSGGVRSHLAQFLLNYQGLLSGGLIGGALSTGWALREAPARVARLSYEGLKKRQGRPLHELRVRPKTPVADVSVVCSFEPETFRHVRTEYTHSIAAPMTSDPRDASRGQERSIRFVEEFSDFRTAGSLTLPHAYAMALTIETHDTIEYQWDVTLTSFVFNAPVAPTEFDVTVP